MAFLPAGCPLRERPITRSTSVRGPSAGQTGYNRLAKLIFFFFMAKYFCQLAAFFTVCSCFGAILSLCDRHRLRLLLLCHWWQLRLCVPKDRILPSLLSVLT